MAPKKKADAGPVEEEPHPGPADEVDEEGENTTVFSVEVRGASMLPRAFETKIAVRGLCKEFRSAPAEASASPQGWEFEKSSFIRPRGQALYDDIVNKYLVVLLKDVATFEVIGEVKLSLLPLLHDQKEVGGEMTLELTDKYRAMWDAPADSGGDAPAAASPSPPVSVEDVPRSTLTVVVRVEELVGPVEDRQSWTAMTFSLGGAFSLPAKLTSIGGEVEMHQLRYRFELLGQNFGGGMLSRPREERPAAEADAADVAETNGEDLTGRTEEEQREDAERYGIAVRFSDDNARVTAYRGHKFIQDFRYMLNHVGGVWLKFRLEEVPSADPKKPNPPEVTAAVSQFAGKAWVRLVPLIRRGVRTTGSLCCPLVGDLQGNGDEATLDSSGSFVRLAVELSHDTAPKPSIETQAPLPQLLPKRESLEKFPSSNDAVALYKDAVTRSLTEVARVMHTPGGAEPSLHEVIEILKRNGNYEEIKSDVRGAVVRICRERLRKDVAVVPGKVLEGEVRDKFMANTHSYLIGALGGVFDELRTSTPLGMGAKGPLASQTPAAASAPLFAPSGCGTTGAGTNISSPEPPDSAAGARRGSLSNKSKSPAGICTPEDGGSPVRFGRVHDVPAPAAEPTGYGDSVAQALEESMGAKKSRESLSSVADTGGRCLNLVYEAEMVGNFDRAATLMQSRLVLREFSEEPKDWIFYAKLCARARGRQAAAEEALLQAVSLLAAGRPHTAETANEVDFMLASLLLDRGRHKEAIRVFRTWHAKDFANPTFRFFLGLALFLAGEDEGHDLLLTAGLPRSWFDGLRDAAAVAEKLRTTTTEQPKVDPAPYAVFLEKLLEFGLPQLVFTFIDHTDILDEEARENEPIALLDAKASAMERDYTAAIARVDSLIARKAASRESWRLAGECCWHLQEYDKALQRLQQALSFKPHFEDPTVYVRLGHVLLQKKRWKQARDAFLKSISFKPTAEAWAGAAYAEFRSEELATCYEALCEANLLDDERPDVWAQLTLVHLRSESWENADYCFRRCLAKSPECDELLLEVAAEYVRRDLQPALAEAAARCALKIRDSGQGRAALADALALGGDTAQAALEAKVALGMLVEHPELRKTILDRSLKWCENDRDAADIVQNAQRLAERAYAEQMVARETGGN
eukprot:TRINITY_DN25019_c0_g6_i1.p1 TRINITY_DN25019_c0_g6~~TRINITY_DN25019_c0_g6_i1.p1  ORF type:complete len:1163 (+),score=190.42 TRINITY_DN25019_c0_g6_i1:46-3489(+)